MDVESLKQYLLDNPPKVVGDYDRIARKVGKTAEAIRYHCRQLGLTIHLSQGGDEKMNKIKLLDYNKLSKSLLDLAKQDRVEIHLPKIRKQKNTKFTEQAVLMLSDIHFGKLNYYLDFNSNKRVLTYSPEIFTTELNRLLDGITTIKDLLLGGYNLDTLNIFALGDLVDNELIYRGQQKFVEEGVIAQVLNLTSYLKQMIISLLKIFPKVKMTVIGGNHARLTSIPEADWDYNNFDYLIGKILQIMFEKEKRVEIIVPESWFYLAQIYSWKYLLHHGNTVYSWMSMPYYGITRQSKSRRMEIPYDMELIAHFHQFMEIATSSHTTTIVNGAWIKNDEFAWKKFGVLSQPQQVFFGVSPKRKKTWEFPIDLENSRSV